MRTYYLKVLLCVVSVCFYSASKAGLSYPNFSEGMSPAQKIAWYEANKNNSSLGNEKQNAKRLHGVAQAYFKLGNNIQAQALLLEAKGLLDTGDAKNLALKTAIYNDLGLVLMARTETKQALEYFYQAFESAVKLDDAGARITAGLNIAKAQIDSNQPKNLTRILQRLQSDLEALPADEGNISKWLSVGKLYRDGAKQGLLSSEYRLSALRSYMLAGRVAESLGLAHLRSFAKGYQGELYEDEGRLDEAGEFTRAALFDAQALSDDTLLYRWQWQLARILKNQGNSDQALLQYRQAVETLNRSRTSMTLGSGINFQKSVGPVFYEFADLLLKQTNTAQTKSMQQAMLQEVIDVLEAVKLAEVEDYFDSECVLLPEQKIKLTDIKSDSAIIYPVLLSDRIELILQLPSGIQQVTSNVDAIRLRDTVNDFRQRIEQYDATHSYQGPAKALHSWLIEPLEVALRKAGVKTLVFVPDGPLRSIPISALFDGEQFLIERYAIATTPGITLTDPKPFQRDAVKVLANGLTEAVQGYSALPNVKKELLNINNVFDTTLYQDKSYMLGAVEQEMAGGRFNIVHFATHGEFSSDHSKSFLLTYDNKLTLDRLEDTIGLRRFQSEPIELLVLSACQTAVGDDRAALGLAGVAIKAGARSALATLWFINDQATSLLISDFYQTLKNEPEASKAQALQIAQVGMLKQNAYRHPSLWAPFLMIGNWL